MGFQEENSYLCNLSISMCGLHLLKISHNPLNCPALEEKGSVVAAV